MLICLYGPMEEVPATLTAPPDSKPWAEILQHFGILILASLVFMSILFYFQELVLIIKFPVLGWIALGFVAIVFIRSLFLVLSWTRRWYREQIGISKALFVLILIVIISLIIVGSSVATRALEPLYGKRISMLGLDSLTSYLSFRSDAIKPVEITRALHGFVNDERMKHGLPVLAYEEELAAIAQAHSDDMAARSYLEHISPDGINAIQRGEKAGYLCDKQFGRNKSHGIGENLALTPLGQVESCGEVYSAEDVARCTIRGWMNSENHRKNILTSTFDKEGFGISRVKNNFYITQNLC